MITSEQDYALEERVRGAAMEMYFLLLYMQHAIPGKPLDHWQPRIQALLDKVEGLK